MYVRLLLLLLLLGASVGQVKAQTDEASVNSDAVVTNGLGDNWYLQVGGI